MAPEIQIETPMEFFKSLVDETLERQKLDASETSTFYLVQLLDTFVRPDRLYAQAGVLPDRPLGELFCLALGAEGTRRITLLKLTGDLALFVSGFLAESLHRSLVNVGYYSRLGSQAYGTIGSHYPRWPATPLFEELAQKFVLFADILAEVSERCAVNDNGNLLRLYERWLATGSHRSAEILRQKGIRVVPSSNDLH